jgi:signal transduction histidine kinase
MLSDDAESEPQAVVVRHRTAPQTPPANDKSEPIDVSKTIVRYVMRHGKGVLSSNAMTDQRFSRGDSVQAYGIRSAMCVPIKFRDRLYGVVHLDSKIANYTYTEDQLLLLTAIGVQTGLAIARAHLYEQRLHSERLAAIGQTVASLSHSIKNIIQGLRGGAEVVELAMRKHNARVLANGWEIVSRNLDRINDLAMNMLTYSKSRQVELEMTNLVTLLEENRLLMQKHFDAKQVALLTDYAPDLPPVPIDPAGIHQAVLNLLSNALDAVEPESGVVTLACMYDEKYQMMRIKVSDTGAGMSREVISHLFEPFHSTKGQRGTGLGLVVTKKVIEEHAGRIDVQSKPGSGTTFVLSLPTNLDRTPSSADTIGPVDTLISDV